MFLHSSIFKARTSPRTADAFPVVASLPPEGEKRRPEMSAVRGLTKDQLIKKKDRILMKDLSSNK